MNQIPTGKYKAVLAIAYDAIGRPFESKYIDGLYIDTVDDRNLNYMETSKGLYDPYCGQFCQINRSGEDQWTWQNIRRDNNDNRYNRHKRVFFDSLRDTFHLFVDYRLKY